MEQAIGLVWRAPFSTPRTPYNDIAPGSINHSPSSLHDWLVRTPCLLFYHRRASVCRTKGRQGWRHCLQDCRPIPRSRPRDPRRTEPRTMSLSKKRDSSFLWEDRSIEPRSSHTLESFTRNTSPRKERKCSFLLHVWASLLLNANHRGRSRKSGKPGWLPKMPGKGLKKNHATSSKKGQVYTPA